jgi:hypothetical protein
LNLRKPIHKAGIFLSLLATPLFSTCAPVTPKHLPPILDEQKIAEFISLGREQDARVLSLISTGRLTIKRPGSETELNVLIAGVRDLEKIKIEITHPWGRPVVHILINGKGFDMVSFAEKKRYSGLLGTSDPSGFFPGRLSLDQIWAFVRAFPAIADYDSVVLSKENQITLFDSNGDVVQVINFCEQSNFPCAIFFPEQDARVVFSRFQNEKGIYYARETELSGSGKTGTLRIAVKQMVFNEAIPEGIFELITPKGFETVPLHGFRDWGRNNVLERRP